MIPLLDDADLHPGAKAFVTFQLAAEGNNTVTLVLKARFGMGWRLLIESALIFGNVGHESNAHHHHNTDSDDFSDVLVTVDLHLASTSGSILRSDAIMACLL